MPIQQVFWKIQILCRSVGAPPLAVHKLRIGSFQDAWKKGCLCSRCFQAVSRPQGAHSSSKAWLKVCEPSGQSHWSQCPYTPNVKRPFIRRPGPWYPSAPEGSTIISTVIKCVRLLLFTPSGAAQSVPDGLVVSSMWINWLLVWSNVLFSFT